MLMMINIPDKEFGIDIDNKFQDFFKRLRAETIDMFQEAFKKGLILSIGYDRAEAIIKAGRSVE